MFKYVSGVAPDYLGNLCAKASEVSSRSRLRSAIHGMMLVPRSRLVVGGRRFEVAGPVVWNSLKMDMRMISSYPVFRRRLKTVLFDMAYNDPLRIN